MNGVLKWRKPVDDIYEIWELEEIETGVLLPIVVKKSEYNYDEMKKHPYLCVHTSIIGIVNANKGHVYPEGTIGENSKGF